MNYQQTNKPIKLNFDKSYQQLSEEESSYLLNHERHVKLGKSIPFQSNYAACEMEQPEGYNFRVGGYRSPITNEVYYWVYNSNGVHYISRLNSDGECQVVFFDGANGCLKLSADPEHSIEEFRAYLRVEKLCSGRHGKYLVWVNGKNEEIGYLDVEASIATESFTTSFFDRCEDRCSLISMCVPKFCGCIKGEFIPLPVEEVSLTSNVVNVGIKIIIRQVYYDLRASEWSDVSTLFYQDNKGCFDSSEGLSRCLKLRIPLGNPQVDKIEVGFSTDNGVNWQLYDTIEKYASYTSVNRYWYQRSLSSSITDNIDDEDECFFFYNFCNNKQCEAIDPKEVSREFNPIPREAQGILPIKNSLGFFNYKKGVCPVNADEIKKLTVSINEADDTDPDCEPEIVSVTVRAIIHDLNSDRNQFVYRGGGHFGDDDDKDDMAFFGGVKYTYPFVGYPDQDFDQSFSGRARNFIAYIEGSEDNWGEMKQYFCNVGLNDKREVGVVAGAKDEASRSMSVANLWGGGGFYFQEYTFKVKKGTQGFIRLCSHHEKFSRPNTSTFLSGQTTDILTYNAYKDLAYDSESQKFEIQFNACGGSVELNEAFVISDGFATHQSDTFGIYGYIKINNIPTEGLGVTLVGIDDIIATTDHNGFFSLSFIRPDEFGTSVDFVVLAEQDCGDFTSIKEETFEVFKGQNIRHDISFDDAEYAEDFLTKVHVNVEDCDGNPIGGLPIALSGSKYKVTDGTGEALFVIRNYISRNRNITAVFMDKNGCFLFDCSDECSPCFSGVGADTPECYAKSANGDVNPEVTTLPIVLNRKIQGLSRRGLKKGGLYQLSAILESPCGKLTAAYELPSIDIPKIQETGKYSFSNFKWTITGTMNLPFDGCLKILRTENLNKFNLQWVVDDAVRSGSTIRLTIQSLNDYNSSFNFKTNSVYKYLEGDRVEFIRDGNGDLFDIATFGLLNYKTISPFNDDTISGSKDEPDYFNQLVISDNGKFSGDLSELKGALIEIQGNKTCSPEPAFFEICTSIPVVNGHPVDSNGVFETFDTFLVNRVSGTSVNRVFEHHSPSDFWGDKLSDTGRAHFINKYENEYRVGRGISLNSPTMFNYFGDLEKVFDAPEQGDIVGMGIKDGNIILAIGENDSFMAQAGNDLVRVGSDNIIRALPADAIISDAQPKIKGAYGCQYPHIGSIYFGDGYATWADGKSGAYIKHDYNLAKNVSEFQVQSFFIKKFQDIESNNRPLASDDLTKYRFCTGFNKVTSSVYITIKKLSDSGINNSKELYQVPNETIVFHPDSNDFTTMVSFTPEGYSSFELYDGDGCSFISFLDGLPYIHTIKSNLFNEFFGTPVDRVVGLTVNKFPDKVKQIISLEIKDEIMWFVYKVTTDNPNFLSEIPPKRISKGDINDNKWSASFLGNKNSREGLFGRGNATGYFINVLLVRDNTDNLKYGTFDNTKRIKYDELDMVNFKFSINEQSGFTQNL